MLRVYALLLVACAVACPVRAQTASKPDGEWRGAFGFGVSATAGNTDSLTYSMNGDAVRRTPVDKITGYVQAVNGRRKVDGVNVRTANQARAGAAYARDANERRFYFGALDLDRNPLIELQLRTVVSAGVGYHVLKSQDHTFDVSTGPAHNREKFTTETREISEWLVAEESTHALTPTISFRQKLTLYANLTDGGEYRGVFDAGMVFKVSNRWNATMTVSDRYQSNPRPGVEKNDVLLVMGVQYVFNP